MTRPLSSEKMPEIQVSTDAPVRRVLSEAEKLPWRGKSAGKSGFSCGGLVSVLLHACLFAGIFLVSGWPAVREDVVLPITLVSAGMASSGSGTAPGGQGESGASSGEGAAVPPSAAVSAGGVSPEAEAEKTGSAARAEDASVPAKQAGDAEAPAEKNAGAGTKPEKEEPAAAEPAVEKTAPAQAEKKPRDVRADSVSRTAVSRNEKRPVEKERAEKKERAGRKGAGDQRRRTAEKKNAALSEPGIRNPAAAQEERVPPRPVPAPAGAAESAGAGRKVPASQSAGNGGTGNGAGRGSASGDGVSKTPGGGEGVFTLGQLDTPPAVIRQVRPEYPPEAQRRGIEGRVTVRLIVDTEGKPTQCAVQSAQPAGVFEKSALKAAGAMRFTPGRSKGRAVRTLVLLPFDYRLR